jgi:phage-related protein
VAIALVYQSWYSAGCVVRPPPKGNKPRPVLGCRFYQNENGNEPVSDWFDKLPDDVCNQIGSDINDVQWDWPVGKPLVDGFSHGLFEVRTRFNGNIYRVLFCISGSEMVLLHGLMKKTKKTPPGDVVIARKRQKESR